MLCTSVPKSFISWDACTIFSPEWSYIFQYPLVKYSFFSEGTWFKALHFEDVVPFSLFSYTLSPSCNLSLPYLTSTTIHSKCRVIFDSHLFFCVLEFNLHKSLVYLFYPNSICNLCYEEPLELNNAHTGFYDFHKCS
jgi:hypothetical protein